MQQLRWSALIALWTIFSGPVFNDGGTFSAPSREPAVKRAAVRTSPTVKKSSPVRVAKRY